MIVFAVSGTNVHVIVTPGDGMATATAEMIGAGAPPKPATYALAMICCVEKTPSVPAFVITALTFLVIVAVTVPVFAPDEATEPMTLNDGPSDAVTAPAMDPPPSEMETSSTSQT